MELGAIGEKAWDIGCKVTNYLETLKYGPHKELRIYNEKWDCDGKDKKKLKLLKYI